MADRRFTLDDALAMLRREVENRKEGLARDAAQIEDHLRLAFEARTVDVVRERETVDYLHVFEINPHAGVCVGASLELYAYGNQLGRSLVAPEIKPGRYRAVLMLTKLPDEEPRG